MTIYKTLREEMMAGGAIDDADSPRPTPRRSVALISGLTVLLLLVWLGVSNIWSLVLVAGLLISVFLHEMGHFVTAGWAGMKRTQFFMGFGPKLWSTHRNGVEYGVRALPLGAFVRIVGMNNLDPVESGDEAVAYSSKPYRWKLLVITAGSIMHIIIAVLIMLCIYSTGGRYQETGHVQVWAVYPGSPAQRAGIELGDIITVVNGQTMTSADNLRATISTLKSGDSANVVFETAGVSKTVDVILVQIPSGSQSTNGFLGVGTDSYGRQKLGLISATSHVASDLWRGMGQTIMGIGTVLNPSNQWSQLTDSHADPNKRPTTVVGITKIAGDVGNRAGLFGVLEILASINIFVGLFNLLPLLPFDGGHAAIATYERIRSRKDRRYSANIEKMWPLTVFVLVALLFLTFTGLYLDITRPF